MGRFSVSDIPKSSVHVFDKYRLPLWPDVDVANRLLAWLVHPHQGFERGA